MNTDLFNITYKKYSGKNYMNIEADISSDKADNSSMLYKEDFRVKMINENKISGILEMHTQYINGIPTFSYNITGLQSLQVILDNQPLNYNLLCKIFTGICSSINSCEKYMLDVDKLVFSQECIFLSSDMTEVKLCYFPQKEKTFCDSLTKLFDFLLKKVDHTDEHGVFLAYSIHNACQSENFSINSIRSFITSILSGEKSACSDTTINTVKYRAPDIPSLQTRNEVLTTSLSDNNNNNTTHSNHTHEQLGANNNFSLTALSDRHKFLLKLFATVCVSAVALIVSVALTFLEIINMNLLIIIIIVIAAFAAYNGYNLLRQKDDFLFPALKDDLFEQKKPLHSNNTCNSDHTLNNPEKDYGSTVLLSSPENHDFHRLVYTGTDNIPEIKLSHYPFTIGKNETCDFTIPNPIISRLHAKITCVPGTNSVTEYFVTDLNSTNGTFLNNNSLAPYEANVINQGDHISFGHLTYIFQ